MMLWEAGPLLEWFLACMYGDFSNQYLNHKFLINMNANKLIKVIRTSLIWCWNFPSDCLIRTSFFFLFQRHSIINNILLWRIYIQDSRRKSGLLLLSFNLQQLFNLISFLSCIFHGENEWELRNEVAVFFFVQRGLDALPGMTILSACLEVVSFPPQVSTFLRSSFSTMSTKIGPLGFNH